MTETLPPIDDERLTAFALNEVDADERAHIEAQLTNDPTAQKTVDDIRATAGLLADELKQERFADLTRAKPVATMPRVVAAQPSRKWTWIASAAALVTIGLLGVTHFGKSGSLLAKRPEIAACAPASKSVSESHPVIGNESPGVDYKYADNKKSPQADEFSMTGSVITTQSNFTTTTATVAPTKDDKSSTTYDHSALDVIKNIEAEKHGRRSDERPFNGPAIAKAAPPIASPIIVPPMSTPPNTATTFANNYSDTVIISNSAASGYTPSADVVPAIATVPTKPALVVPPDVLDKAKIGDHFESTKLARRDTKSTYGKPDAKIFHSVIEDKKRAEGKKAEPLVLDDTSRSFGSRSGLGRDIRDEKQGLISSKIKDADQAVSINGKKEEPTPDIFQKTTPSAKKPDSGDIAVVTIHGSYSITPPQPSTVQPGGEAYAVLPENEFESVRNAPLSTFSADVDTAAYSNVRRFLGQGQLPPPEAVRVEELINYFKYNYTMEKTADPFSTGVESAACPWNTAHRLVRVAVKSHDLVENKRPQSNFVFLIDVSGSMDEPNRLPLVKDGMKSLVRRLGETDRVAIVTYAGESGVALQSTNCSDKERILNVIDSLKASGGTNGGAGIQTAYSVAKNNFIKGGVNRVILATDGDFNVGVTSPEALVKLIENESQSGVFLTALGYGMGNYKDAMLQKLADKGHGNYAYIDNAEESRKALVEQMNSTLVAVAKDVKFQVEFNPARASEYRLIGYEKRAMPAQDFNNDTKDAGVLGAGHTVTAFYEVVTTGTRTNPGIDNLKYQAHPAEPVSTDASPELLTVKIRYKSPEGNVSKRLEIPFTDKGEGFERASSEFKFAASVALFAQVLRRSQFIGNAGMKHVIDWADDCRGPDEGGYRREFIQLARKAAELRGER